VALITLAAILGGVVAFFISSLRGRGTGEDGHPAALEDLQRRLARIEEQAREQAEIFRLIPPLLHQMFTVPGRRGAAPLALSLVQQLFRPEQCAIFMARPAQRRLALADGHGLPASLVPGFELEYGQGRVGHVAETRTVMDEADFAAASPLLRSHLDATATPGLRADLLAPIEDDGQLIGVLCVGGLRTGRGHEKALLRMVADVTAVALAQISRLRATEEAANVDSLTGVYNKRHLQRRLEEELQKAQREGVPLSLLMLDIDHFKNYNDANGHLEGDEVLKTVGQVLKGSIREDDVAARYGGEEFVVLYVGAGKDLALRLAEGLRRAVESFAFPHRERQPLGALTISGGVASFPGDVGSGVDLIRAADQALYEAKASGRNRILAARIT
jgi:diguanylate cyclase (GGDEF)-like protein